MKKVMLSTLIFLCFFSTSYAYIYGLAICAIFRDDAKYIPEWIEFHQKQGVEHFFLYDNLSSDEPLKYLLPYITDGIVTLTDWSLSHSNGTEWNNIQCAAYWDCVQKVEKTVKWLAVLDTDEFLFSPSKEDLRKVLKDYKDYPAVAVNWVCYGTSQVPCINPGEKMLDKLVYRAQLDFGLNKYGKSIVRPKKVSGCGNPHYFNLKSGQTVKEDYSTILDSFSVNKLRINHYWSRDLNFFYTVKLSRQKEWSSLYKEIMSNEAHMNAIYDPILVSP